MEWGVLFYTFICEAGEIEGDRNIIKEMEAIQTASEPGGMRPI